MLQFKKFLLLVPVLLLLILVPVSFFKEKQDMVTNTSEIVGNTVVANTSYRESGRSNIIQLPVIVSILTFPDEPSYSSNWTSTDVALAFDLVNDIFNQSNINFNVTQIRTLAIPNSVFYQAGVDSLSQIRQKFMNARGRDPIPIASTVDAITNSYTSLDNTTWYVNIIGQSPSALGGLTSVTLGAVTVFQVKLDKQNLVTELHPAILAHELGHTLIYEGPKNNGHYMQTEPGDNIAIEDNLMREGLPPLGQGGWKLSTRQINQARDQASIGPLRKENIALHHVRLNKSYVDDGPNI